MKQCTDTMSMILKYRSRLAKRFALTPNVVRTLLAVREGTTWVWTTKFDTATWLFLKFDMRHGALVTRQEGENL